MIDHHIPVVSIDPTLDMTGMLDEEDFGEDKEKIDFSGFTLSMNFDEALLDEELLFLDD